MWGIPIFIYKGKELELVEMDQDQDNSPPLVNLREIEVWFTILEMSFVLYQI